MINLMQADRKVRAIFLSCKTPAHFKAAKRYKELFMDELHRQDGQRLREMYGPDNRAFTKRFWRSLIETVLITGGITIAAIVLFIVMGLAKLVGIKQL